MNGSVKDNKVAEQGKSSEKLVVGRIAGVYGVKGWVKIFSYTDPMESIVDYKPWFIRAENKKNAPWTQITLEAGKRHAKTVIAKLEHCDDRDLALTYVGNEIAIELKQLEALKRKNEYYWHDLIGLRVINQQGIELGTVKNLMETGANDVLVVSEIKDESASENGETVKAEERLIPWTMNHAIIGVDLERKVIEVDWDADF